MRAPKTAILVVEDEPLLRRLLALTLWKEGLTAIEASTGQAAVDLYRQHAGVIGAVVLDITLPDVDGRTVLALLRAIDPAVQCFFVTGNTHPAFLAELEGHYPAGVFAKPFALQDLTDALQECALGR